MKFYFFENLLKNLNISEQNDEILVLPFFKLLMDNMKKPEIKLDERVIIIQT